MYQSDFDWTYIRELWYCGLLRILSRSFRLSSNRTKIGKLCVDLNIFPVVGILLWLQSIDFNINARHFVGTDIRSSTIFLERTFTFPWQQCFRERATKLRCANNAYLYSLCFHTTDERME
jgi:hypothetical protein